MKEQLQLDFGNSGQKPHAVYSLSFPELEEAFKSPTWIELRSGLSAKSGPDRTFALRCDRPMLIAMEPRVIDRQS